MDHTPEELEHFSAQQDASEEETQPSYTPRPLHHRVLAWVLIAVVVFAILGTCHWMVVYR